MKDNKGFTLIELLAVVAILIMILALIAPKIFRQLKNAENITDKEQINAIINASKLYMNQHSELLPDHNSIYSITLDDLKQSELIKNNQVLNPSTKEELTGCVIVNYENNKYKYQYKDNCTYTVTFDANGGNVSQSTKEVIYGQTYNDLPTPTRSGYTFLGWNGKNMFNEEGFINEMLKYYSSDKLFKTTFEGKNVLKMYGGITGKKYTIDNIENNTSYTITFDVYNTTTLYNATNRYLIGPVLKAEYSDGTSTFLNIFTHQGYETKPNEEWKNIKITTDNSKTFSAIGITFQLGSPYSYIKNFQIEQGSTATLYEPYYITTDTTVTQEQNHTLKAIWQANS